MFLEESHNKDRSQFIGGSDVPIIMAASPYKSPYRLWLEKTGAVEQEDISGLFHVKRGTDNEPIALAKLEQLLGVKFEANKRFIGDFEDYMSCEVDGYHQDFIVEIKCMGKQAHENTKAGIIPEHYNIQCQWNMLMSSTESCVFVSYRPEDGSLYTETIGADKKLQDKLLKAVNKFWKNNIIEGQEPALTDLDFADMEKNDRYLQLAETYKTAVENKKAADEVISSVKESLDALMTEMDVKKAKGFGLRLNKYQRKGSVDYKKVPELTGVDLEPYRKKAVGVFAVSEDKS